MTNDYGIPSDPVTLGGGYGYLPFYEDLLKNNMALQLGQGGLGNDLLKSLMEMRNNPAAGPLGLAAYGAFGGGGQSVAAGTGGKGLVNPYGGAFDRALSGMMSGVFGNKGSIYNPDNGGQVNLDNTTFNDPNKAPALTPAAASAAPNPTQDWISAWQAFNPGKTWGKDKGIDYPAPGLKGGGTVATSGGGGKSEAPTDTRVSEHAAELKHFIAKALNDGDFAERVKKASQVSRAVAKVREHDAAANATPPPMMSPTPGASPVPMMATGGVVVGGQPHFIVDAKGNKVAAITEDGQPEQVSSTPGGVEVTPMNPVRRALYEQSKAWSRMLAGLDPQLGQKLSAADRGGGGIPGAATGASFLFPNIPGSGMNSDPSGANSLPSAGGPAATRQQQVGSAFKSSYNPATGAFTLPSEATDATSANDNAGYAKMLGGAWSAGNMAIDPGTLRSLNAGQYPSKLLSSTEMATLDPSQRAGYLAFLQQGLGLTPEDAQFEIKRFTPTALG